MSRAPEYPFIPTNPEDIVIWLTSSYEEMMGVTVQPASPERHFIQWLAAEIVLERVMTNYAANQNIQSRAVGTRWRSCSTPENARRRGRRAAPCASLSQSRRRSVC